MSKHNPGKWGYGSILPPGVEANIGMIEIYQEHERISANMGHSTFWLCVSKGGKPFHAGPPGIMLPLEAFPLYQNEISGEVKEHEQAS